MKNNLWVSGKTCFLGKREVHSTWISLLNIGLDQLTSACSTLKSHMTSKGIYILTGSSSVACREASAKMFSFGCVAVWDLSNKRQPLAWIACRQHESSRNHLGENGQESKLEQERSRGGGLVMTHEKNVLSFSVRLKFLPPSFEMNYICSD